MEIRRREFFGGQVLKFQNLAFIGPTPNLQMYYPYEATPSVFFNDSSFSKCKLAKRNVCIYASRIVEKL